MRRERERHLVPADVNVRMVPGLFGLIEGIIYLCKPDEEFVRVYVDGHKEWF